MKLRRTNKSKRLQPLKPGQRRVSSDQLGRSVPITRYYKADTQRPATNKVNREDTVAKRRESTKKSRLSLSNNSFIKLLPQRLAFVAIIALLIFNLTLSSARVRLANPVSSYRTLEAYRDGVSEIFNESLLYKTKITLSSEKLESRISEHFPEVNSVSAILPIAGRKLQVVIGFVEPLVRIKTSAKSTGVIGQNGRYISANDVNSQPSLSDLPLLTLQDFTDIEQGSQALTTKETDLLALLVSEFDGSSPSRHSIKSILFDIKKREMQVRFNGVKYYAKLTPEREGRGQVGTLVASIDQLIVSSSEPKEYIDVRVEGRMFVK